LAFILSLNVFLLLLSYVVVRRRLLSGPLFGGVTEANAWRLFLLLFLFGVFLRLLAFNTLTPTDEPMYAYMAKLVYSGYRPYVDFFMSQPPLYPYMTSFVFRLFGVGVIQCKILPLLSSILSIPLLYVLVKRFYAAPPALFSVFLFSVSPGVVENTRSAVLYSELVFLSLFSAYLFLRGLDVGSRRLLFFSGACMAFAVFFRLFGVLLLVFVFVTLFFVRRKSFFRHFAPVLFGFAVVSCPLFCFFYSDAFVYQVFVHHSIFPSFGFVEKLDVFFAKASLAYPLLLSCGLVGLLLTLRQKVKSASDHYFTAYLTVSLACFFALKYTSWVNLYMYVSFVSPALAVLSSKLLRHLDRRYLAFYILFFVNLVLLTHYLMFLNDVRWTSSLDSAVEYTLLNTRDGDVIAGSSAVAPAVAFQTGRLLPKDLVEYSRYRFSLGEPRQAEAVSSVSGDIKLVFLLSSDSVEDGYLACLVGDGFVEYMDAGSIRVFRRTQI